MKMKITNIAFISLLILSIACKDEKEASISKEELLTANASKSWKLDYSSSDKYEDLESCKTTSDINSDNEWIFNTNGDFKFSNGTITEADCEECCSDLANLVGNWSIFSNGDSISIVVDGRLDGDVVIPEDEFELIRVRLTGLTKDEMVFTAMGDTTVYVAQ
jgi:hypothetical protein